MTKPDIRSIDFDQSPFIVIWETTRACALRCVHCRADAIDHRDPQELSTEQAFELLKEIRLFGKPLVVLTGGDPLRRPDVNEIVRRGAELGLRIAMTPSGTEEVTFEALQKLKQSGLARLAVSLDGTSGAVHDSFRRVSGSFDWTLNIIRWANELGLPVQINTTVSKHNLHDLDAFAEFLEPMKIALWSVFFLVPIGRAKLEDEIRAADYEKTFNKMARLADRSSFDIKSTEAPQYRRVLIQHKKKNIAGNGEVREGSFTWMDASGQNGERSAQGVNDGKGFVFISHTGDICPSGFLPLSAGNVKIDSLVDVYRSSKLFRSLRDASKLKGKCGACEYKTVCGGSRARAFAVHQDLMASDPFCVHVPKGYRVSEEETKFW